MKDARWCMTSSRPSTSQPRSVPALIAAIFTALTVTLALRGVSLAFTRDEAPVSSAAATGALDSTPSAPIAESGTKTVPAATAEEPAAGIANGAPSLVGAVTSSARQQAATPGLRLRVRRSSTTRPTSRCRSTCSGCTAFRNS